MNDPFAVLEEQILSAARRIESAQAVQPAPTASERSPSRRKWWLATALAALVVSGSAAAAIVASNGNPSKPLTGPITTHHRGAADRYQLALAPDLTLGANGWCAEASTTSKSQLATSGASCGRAPRAGSMLIAGGLSSLASGQAMLFLIVDRHVASAILHDGRRIRSAPAAGLPPGDQLIAATVTTRGYHLTNDLLKFKLLGADGRPLPGADDDLRDLYSSRGIVGEPARAGEPAACSLAPAAHLDLTDVAAVTTASRLRAIGAAYLTCATATAKFNGATLHVAVLAAPAHAQAPTALPGARPTGSGLVETSGDLTARALPSGWLVVHGGDARTRAGLLAELQANIAP